MGCCSGCKDDVELVEFDAAIRFDTNGAPNPVLIGKNLKLVTGTLLTRDGAIPKGGFRVDMVTNYPKHRISIYRIHQPFDELMVLLQFDETNGVVKADKFAMTEPLVQLHLTLTKEHVEPKLYQELAPLVYRVPNRSAMMQLFDKRKLAGRALESAHVQVTNNDRKENWPMLAIFHDNFLGVNTRNAPVVNIPNWKNNADWQ